MHSPNTPGCLFASQTKVMNFSLFSCESPFFSWYSGQLIVLYSEKNIFILKCPFPVKITSTLVWVLTLQVYH